MWSREQISRALFYLLVFLLPWQTRWIFHDPTLGGETWEYGRLSVYGWDIVLVVLVIICWPLIWRELQNVKFQISNVKANPNSAPTYYLLPTTYLTLISLAFLSGLWAPEPWLTTYWGLRLLEGGLLWLLVRVLKPKLSMVCWSLALAGTLQALWGLGQFVMQATFASKWLGVAVHPVLQGGTSVLLNEGGRWLRAYSGQVHPNVLGGLLVITSLATILLYLRRKSQLVKVPLRLASPFTGILNPKSEINPKSQTPIKLNSYSLLLLYTVQLVGLFVSFSRGAWLALVITLGLWWFIAAEHRPRLWSALAITTAVFILFGSVLWQPTRERIFSNTSRLEQQSLEERVGGVGESENLLKTAWWRGVGLGNYTAALADFSPGLRAYRYQPVHNLFLLVFTELGLVGLGLFLWLFYKRLFPFIIRNSLFIIPVLVTSFFDHYWWTSASMMLLFWLIMAWPELIVGDDSPP